MDKVTAALAKFWASVPRKVKYVTAGLALAAIKQYWPDAPLVLDPQWLAAGGGVLALLHTITDVASNFRSAPRADIASTRPAPVSCTNCGMRLAQ